MFTQSWLVFVSFLRSATRLAKKAEAHADRKLVFELHEPGKILPLIIVEKIADDQQEEVSDGLSAPFMKRVEKAAAVSTLVRTDEPLIPNECVDADQLYLVDVIRAR